MEHRHYEIYDGFLDDKVFLQMNINSIWYDMGEEKL